MAATRFQPAPGLEARLATQLAAPVVARLLDQLARAAANGAPPVKVWHTVGDNRVRPWHQAAEGLKCPDNLRFPIPHSPRVGHQAHHGEVEMLRYPRDPTAYYLQTRDCLPGETQVSARDALACSRRRYEGALVTVRTAAGHKLSATPNHPVVLGGRWTPIRFAQKGDQLVSERLPWQVGHTAGGAPDIDDTPTRIDQLYMTLTDASQAQRVHAGPLDFHGDTTDGYVDVVSADSLLLDDWQALAEEEAGDLLLELADMVPVPLPRLRGRDEGGRVRRPSGTSPHARGMSSAVGVVLEQLAYAGMGGSCQPGSTLRTLAGHPYDVGGGPSASGHAGLSQHAGDYGTSDAVMLGQAEFGLPGTVTADEVVGVDVDARWHGEVYNLHTRKGWYLANGITVHNCRCSTTSNDDLARSIRVDGPPRVTGARVEGSVSTGYDRAAESEYGTSEDAPARFMRGALQRVAQT